jgi:hypothetical protein
MAIISFKSLSNGINDKGVRNIGSLLVGDKLGNSGLVAPDDRWADLKVTGYELPNNLEEENYSGEPSLILYLEKKSSFLINFVTEPLQPYDSVRFEGQLFYFIRNWYIRNESEDWNSSQSAVRLHIVAGQKIKDHIKLSNDGYPITIDYSVFYLGNINREAEFKIIKDKVDAGRKLLAKDLTNLIILPISGERDDLDINFFKECYSLGQKAFKSDRASRINKIFGEFYTHILPGLYYKMLSPREWLALSQVKEMHDIIGKIKDEGTEETRKEIAIALALRLRKRGKIDLSDILKTCKLNKTELDEALKTKYSKPPKK